ncbi:hypothetical protein DUNSADRAFT_3504 [Dunaliella salina]|uniref:Uncharacterized protein n=1 Tax=Dunaliella salina TaxID=3046 RepID=A0ABQ7GTU2_DUNSA|nr:hypothetical protein DUNSADRAFT_3504 [Dunaliella salina]|eukprot:KAF5838017.1 hypothetical protein DUNSADRAFT_3504 [Dunaliella salina]
MHSSFHQQSLSESHAWSDRGQESEQEEDEAPSPATIHLPHIVAVANRRRKGGHKQGKHAGPALQLPKLATNSQTIMARGSAHAGPGSPHGHHHLSHLHLHRRPKSHPHLRHPNSPSRPLSHHASNNGLASSRSSLQLQLQQQAASPAFVPPLSPMPPALRPADGQVHAEAKEAKSLTQASSAAAALRGAAQPGAAERGDGTAQAPVSSMTAAAAAAGAEGAGEIGGVAAGAEVDDIDALLAAIGADMEQPGDAGGAAARLESLPCTLCTSAAGDVYMVGLSDVQYMLHKRKLGAEGLAILQRFENSIVQPLDALALKRGLTKDAQRPPMVSIQVPPSPSKASPSNQVNEVLRGCSRKTRLTTHPSTHCPAALQHKHEGQQEE